MAEPKIFEEVMVGYLVPDLYNPSKKNFSETFPYGIFDKNNFRVEHVYVKRLKNKRTKEEAIIACEEAGENPHSYLDHADLWNGKENWEYFVSIRHDLSTL